MTAGPVPRQRGWPHVPRRRALALLLALPLPAGAAATLRQRYAAFRAVEAELYRQDLTDGQRAGLLAEAYATVSPGRLEGLDPEALLLIYDAADRMALVSREPAYVQRMAEVLLALPAPPLALLQRTHHAMVAARLFDAAGAWRARFPEAGLAPPPIAGAARPGEPAVLVQAGAGLQVRKLDILRGRQVLAIGHPDCAFCARFLQALARDPAFGRAFAGRLTWIAPQQRELAMDGLKRWNRQHPEAPLAIVYRQADLPMIGRWSTPTFYFLQDGVVQTQLDGWPGLSRKADMLKALAALDQAAG